jgi:hypothetical protein
MSAQTKFVKVRFMEHQTNLSSFSFLSFQVYDHKPEAVSADVVKGKKLAVAPSKPLEGHTRAVRPICPPTNLSLACTAGDEASLLERVPPITEKTDDKEEHKFQILQVCLSRCDV